MKQELQEKLFNDFPVLFERRLLPMSQTCMCWGIETGSGWFNLIYEMCQKMEQLRLTENPEVRFEQIKEKFGTLRAYLYSGSDKAYEIVEEAEEKSAITCENTGNPRQLYVRGGLD